MVDVENLPFLVYPYGGDNFYCFNEQRRRVVAEIDLPACEFSGKDAESIYNIS